MHLFDMVTSRRCSFSNMAAITTTSTSPSTAVVSGTGVGTRIRTGATLSRRNKRFPCVLGCLLVLTVLHVRPKLVVFEEPAFSTTNSVNNTTTTTTTLRKPTMTSVVDKQTTLQQQQQQPTQQQTHTTNHPTNQHPPNTTNQTTNPTATNQNPTNQNDAILLSSTTIPAHAGSLNKNRTNSTKEERTSPNTDEAAETEGAENKNKNQNKNTSNTTRITNPKKEDDQNTTNTTTTKMTATATLPESEPEATAKIATEQNTTSSSNNRTSTSTFTSTSTRKNTNTNTKTNTNTTKAGTTVVASTRLKSDSDLSDQERHFADRYCDLAHLPQGAWYPSSSGSATNNTTTKNSNVPGWQQRAPYVLIAGVWNAGVNPLVTELLKHHRGVLRKANTMGFFLPKQFAPRYMTKTKNDNSVQFSSAAQTKTTTTNTTASSSSFKVKVFAARERMYAQVYSKPTTTTTMPHQYMLDVSPGLVFYASQTAYAVLCTVPWVKVIIVLRNPIDRLYQQYVYSRTHFGLTLSLEDWLAPEMHLLQRVGLLTSRKKEAEEAEGPSPSRTSERDAWTHYQAVRQVAGAIGRSLYVFQIEDWLTAYRHAKGKEKLTDVLHIVTMEQFEDPLSKHHAYQDLVHFLDFDTSSSVSTNSSSSSLTPTPRLAPSAFNRTGNPQYLNNDSVPPMNGATRAMLQHFFRPYNQRLTHVLREHGYVGNWAAQWDAET